MRVRILGRFVIRSRHKYVMSIDPNSGRCRWTSDIHFAKVFPDYGLAKEYSEDVGVVVDLDK